MGRVIRIVVLVVLLLMLAFVAWLRSTPDGRTLADGMLEKWEDLRYGAAERDAAEKLAAKGAMVGRLPPSNRVVSVDCNHKILGDDGYRLVGRCFHLEEVSFIACDLNDDRMRNLTGLVRLTSLSACDSPEVTDAGIKHIAPLHELVGLILKGTNVGDESLPQIGRLRELASLDLSFTKVTDAGMPALCSLSKLESLYLIHTNVTDDGVAKLVGLSSLREILLGGTKVTAKGKADLQERYPGLSIK